MPCFNFVIAELTIIAVVTVNIPANTIVQYKYIRKNGGSVTWESDPNNQFTSVASGSQTLSDTWR